MTDTSPTFNSEYTQGVYRVPEFKPETPQHIQLFHLDRLLSGVLRSAPVELAATRAEVRFLEFAQTQQNRIYEVDEQIRKQALDKIPIDLPAAYEAARNAETNALRALSSVRAVNNILKNLQQPDIYHNRLVFPVPGELIETGDRHYKSFSDTYNASRIAAKRLSHPHTVVGKRRKKRADAVQALTTELRAAAVRSIRKSVEFRAAQKGAKSVDNAIEVRRRTLAANLSAKIEQVIKKLDWEDILDHVDLDGEWIVNPVPRSPVSSS